jgi:hypothetical protein
VRKFPAGIGEQTLADQLNLAAGEVRDASQRLPRDIVSFAPLKGAQLHFIHKAAYDDIVKEVNRILARHHHASPLVEEGKTALEFTGMLGLPPGTDAEQGLRSVLEQMKTNGALKQVRHTWALASHTVAVTGDLDKNISLVENHLRESGMKTPLMTELTAFAKTHGFDERALRQVLAFLVTGKRVYASDGSYIHASIVDACRKKLLDKLVTLPEGITVAGFRDLVCGNRKICLLLMVIFDHEKIVERQGDFRVITDRGRDVLAGRAA